MQVYGGGYALDLWSLSYPPPFTHAWGRGCVPVKFHAGIFTVFVLPEVIYVYSNQEKKT